MRKVLLIFSQLTDADVEWMSKAGDRVHLEAGTTLIPLGSRVENLYFVLDGRLAIKSHAGEVIRLLESGEVIGEMSLVDPEPTVVAVEIDKAATLLRISNVTVRSKLATDFPFAARFYRALCVFLADRMRTTTMRMGYGAATPDPHKKDELNEDLLDTVHLAGARFDRMLKRLAG